MFIRFFRDWRRSLLGLLFVLWAMPAIVWANSFPGAQRQWHRYESRHFELFSQVGERKSRDLLRDIEALRAFMLAKLDLKVRRPTPVTIYFFGSDEDYQHYLPQSLRIPSLEGEKSLGQYMVYPDRDVIMLSPFDGETSALWVVQSNLAQHLLLSHAGHNPPGWLSSALALLFGTFTAKSDKVEWGRADDLRQALARKYPQVSLEHVFHGGNRPFLPGMLPADYRNLPQAHAWGVLHYLYFGQSEVPASAVNKFIHRILQPGIAGNRERMRQQVIETFGIDYKEMEARLARYLKAGKFKARTEPFDQLPARESFVQRPMTEAENNRALAELAYRTQEDAIGRFLLLQAGEAKDTRAFEALGSIGFRRFQDRSAAESWRQAMDMGSTNPAVLRYVALTEWSRWFSRLDLDFLLPAEAADQLRSRLLRWIEVQPDQNEPYEALAWVEASVSVPKIEHVNLVQGRFPRLDRQAQVLLAMARVRVRLGDHAAAEQILSEIDNFAPSTGERALAKALQDSIRKKAERSTIDP